MDIRESSIQVAMKADKRVNFGNWTGERLRRGIKDRLFLTGKKDVFELGGFTDPTTSKSIVMAVTSVINSEFSDSDIITDTLDYTIRLFGGASDRTGELLSAIGFINVADNVDGSMTRFNLIGGPTITRSSINIDRVYEVDNRYKDAEVKIMFVTPFVSKSKDIFNVESIIRSCTTRMTGMYNAALLGKRFNFHYFLNQASRIRCIPSVYEKHFERKYKNVKAGDDKDGTNIIGYTGSLTLQGDLSGIMNMLRVVSKLNIGKSCVLGFGKIALIES